MRTGVHWRRLGRRLLAASMMVAVCAPAAHGLDPARALSQFVRETWGPERGYVGGVVRAIAETPDGYLWLGTDQGLVRFDGATFTIVTEGDLSASGAAVLALVADGRGRLWIRRRGPNVERFAKGRFDDALWSLSPREEFVMDVAQGRDGSVLYAGRFHGIARHAHDRFSTLAAWPEQDPVHTIVETPDGRVWLGTDGSGVFVLRDGRLVPGPRALAHASIQALAPAATTGVWIATRRGVSLWDGDDTRTARVPAVLGRLQVACMLRDRDANVWMGTTHGLVRVSPDGTVAIDQAVGRESGAVTALFEDREGSLWVGGATGIHRLREGGFTPFGREEGLPADHTGPVHVDADGRTWFAPVAGGLYWLRHGRIERLTSAGLDEDVVLALAGRAGDVWAGRTRGGVTRLRVTGDVVEATTFTTRDGLAPGRIAALHVSRDGTVWAGTPGAGVSALRPGAARFVTHATADGLTSSIVHSIAETSDGTIWIGTPRGLSAWNGVHWRSFGAAHGLPPGAMNVVLGAGADTALWAGAVTGLARVVDGRAEALHLPNALRDTIVGLAEDGRGSLWVATTTRVLQVALASLRRGVVDDGDIREFERTDGLRGLEATRRERTLVRAPDGRLWLSTTAGMAMVDPARLQPRAPAVAGVRAILVDGVPLNLSGREPLRVPAGRERVAFAFEAVSLTFPRDVRVRYRLDGIDSEWSAPTTTRDAIYTHLAPGPYRLRVMSSTGDGRWRESDAPVSFVVAPAFWQTWWFRTVAVGCVGGIVFATYRMRTRQLTRQLNVRFEERLAERTRIAQELHDTLLQGVLSVSMQLHAAVDDLPSDAPNRGELEGLLAQMRRVSDEGRVAVRGLRTRSADDLEQAFCAVQQEYASRCSADVEVTVEGRVRPLHPLIRDEVYRIGREALVNAFRHACAGRIAIELEYGDHHLRLLVRDDGCGIPPCVMDTGRDGHWGLIGMKERTRRIGGEFTLASRVGSGTDVQLLLPASVAFSPAKDRPRD